MAGQEQQGGSSAVGSSWKAQSCHCLHLCHCSHCSGILASLPCTYHWGHWAEWAGRALSQMDGMGLRVGRECVWEWDRWAGSGLGSWGVDSARLRSDAEPWSTPHMFLRQASILLAGTCRERITALPLALSCIVTMLQSYNPISCAWHSAHRCPGWSPWRPYQHALSSTSGGRCRVNGTRQDQLPPHPSHTTSPMPYPARSAPLPPGLQQLTETPEVALQHK